MIDINKKYKTRDGREVRIYATDGANGKVHGAIKSSIDGAWYQHEWFENGLLVRVDSSINAADLIEVRPRHKRTVWLNVYATEIHFAYDTKEEADSSVRRPKRIACIKVDLDFEEGEGL